jgi:hypothetical protein
MPSSHYSRGSLADAATARPFRTSDGGDDDEGPIKANVRAPLQLLRAGVRLASLIPPQAQNEVNTALRRQGVGFDLSQI